MKIEIKRIKADPAFQFRAAVNPEIVAQYAEAMGEGATFPPVQLYQVGEELLLVDGWHRLEAARKTKAKQIDAEVTKGTRGEALKAAIGANATHGLARTNEDKRRAVAALLMDPELCRLSAREAAAVAGVSHVYIVKQRERYGVEAGRVLEDEQRRRVDGEVPKVWEKVLKSHYLAGDIMRAGSPARLAAYWSDDEQRREALDLRADELATDDAWPWVMDKTHAQRVARVGDLDSVADLERALRSTECPEREELYRILRAHHVGTNMSYLQHDAEELLGRLSSRPKLWAEVKAKIEGLRAAAAAAKKSPYGLAQDIVAMKDPDAQAAAVRAAADDVIDNLVKYLIKSLPIYVRIGALRERMGADAHRCPIPGCDDGWRLLEGSCVLCGLTLEELHESAAEVDHQLGELLAIPHSAVRLGDMVIDRRDLDLLRALGEAVRHDRAAVEKWLAKAPPRLEAFRSWLTHGEPPEVVFGGDEDEDEEGEGEEEPEAAGGAA